MPWYYAGPEGKPVGPLSLEELQARRAGNFVSPQTYVIEQLSPGTDPAVWKRYGEIFAAGPPVLPPVPSSATYPATPPLPVPALPVQVTVTPTPVAHPLFPSAQKTFATSPGGPVFTGAHPASYRGAIPASPWCTWGFGLGLASFLLVFFCGIGVFIAPPAIVVCIVGLVKLHRSQTSHGRGWAIAGLTLAILTLLIALLFAAIWGTSTFHFHSQTTTEQSSNDSDSQ